MREFEARARKHLQRVAGAEFFEFCATAITESAWRKAPIDGSEVRNWSGARDLNPGPHGPEPAVCRVLLFPRVSFRVLLCSNSPAFVSPGVLLCPPDSANA